MTIMEAIYRNGVLKPTHPLDLADQSVVRVHITDESATEHPHVTRREGIHGTRPVIRNTRIPVKTLVRYIQMGMSGSEILAGFPELTAAQLYDALSYYYDNQAEMEADMADDDGSALLEQFNLHMEPNGRLSAPSTSADGQ